MNTRKPFVSIAKKSDDKYFFNKETIHKKLKSQTINEIKKLENAFCDQSQANNGSCKLDTIVSLTKSMS